MRVITASTLHAWGRQHSGADTTLRHWLRVTRAASWANIQDVRRQFPHADPVRVASGGTVIVFNIGSFRLVTAIKYRSWTVYLLMFMTHAEYDKGLARKTDGKPGKWRDNL